MQIEDAILGLLNERPMSGYDLKKQMTDSPHMPWSGNNNQIYKALLQLDERELVASETLHRENAPSKKVYTLTDAGRAALRSWLHSLEPELPEIREPFLIQLEMAARIDARRLPRLLETYLDELDAQRLMQRERRRRLDSGKKASPRDDGSAQIPEDIVTSAARLVDAAILDRIDRFYRDEIDWASLLLEQLSQLAPSRGEPLARPTDERKKLE